MYSKTKRRSNSYRNIGNISIRKRIKNFFISESSSYHKIDYAKKTEYKLPIQRKSRLSRKKKLEIVLLSCFVISLFFIVAFHPFFTIKQINTEGLNRINENEFNEDIIDILNCKKLFIFSCNAYIFTDVNELRDVLFDKYSLNSLIIEKEFPNIINIDLEEKISTIIYDDGVKYSFVDLSGNLVESIANVSSDEWFDESGTSTSTLAIGQNLIHKPNTKRLYDELGNYPLIYDKNIHSDENGQVLKEEFVASFIDWYNLFNKELNESINYIVLMNSVGDATIYNYSGWRVVVRLGERFGSQSDQLKYLLEKEIGDKYFSYIELRYPGRAYWQ